MVVFRGYDIPLTALLISLALSAHGLRKKSLSPSGALTAFVVGAATMGGGLSAFGFSTITFYLLGSRATKYGKQRKAKLEDAHEEAGNRTGWQVLSNSLAAVGACTMWSALYVPTSLQAHLVRKVGIELLGGVAFKGDEWCSLDPSYGWSHTLVLVVLGQYGCCLGDTLASELGILSSSPPRLVTTFKSVPPGTNGGISIGGTIASIIGGIAIGVTMSVCLLLENTACQPSAFASLIAWGAFAGGFGSLLDSFLGATVQQSRFSIEKKVVLQDESASVGDIKVISGLDILTNNQVNLVSGVVCGILVGFLG